MGTSTIAPAAPGYVGDYNRLVKVSYTHDAMIDMILAEPLITQMELASRFGYTQPWVCRIIGSDSFQQALAARRSEIVNPVIVASLEERLKGLAIQATDVLANNLDATKNPDTALRALEISTKALGFGARANAPPPQQNNFVVMLPPKAESAEAWAEQMKQVGPAK